MDLGLSAQPQTLKNVARAYPQIGCPEAFVRDMEEDPRGYRQHVWRKMAEQGWQGLVIPTQYGGTGHGYLELIVLLEEGGRAAVPGPFISTVVLGAQLILEAGTVPQKEEYLRRIAAGDLVVTLAFTEPSARFDAGEIATTAPRDDEHNVLNGIKLFVPDADVADVVIIVARGPGTSGDDCISLFLFDAHSDGVIIETIFMIDSDNFWEVILENACVSVDNLLELDGEGWGIMKRLIRKAMVAECAYLVGLTQMDFELRVKHAKDRIQFGRPIGSFQAIQHKAADMVIDVDSGRLITYRAAWSIAMDDPDAEIQSHMAKAWCRDATRHVVANGQHIHAGAGFRKDDIIGLHYRRQKRGELMWGDADYHLDELADSR